MARSERRRFSQSLPLDLSELAPIRPDVDVTELEHPHVPGGHRQDQEYGAPFEIDALDEGQSNAPVALVRFWMATIRSGRTASIF
jgi:hypothetical protein